VQRFHLINSLSCKNTGMNYRRMKTWACLHGMDDQAGHTVQHDLRAKLNVGGIEGNAKGQTLVLQFKAVTKLVAVGQRFCMGNTPEIALIDIHNRRIVTQGG
jgi:molybdenum-dependent DNA-binding transcriptional regulator ModE